MAEISRDELAEQYFELLPYEPYPVQQEAMLAFYTADQGVLVAAPTGTGKTLIAEAALFEALRTGKRAYYTTPLIALTEQKLQEMRQSAIRWGFSADDVGLVTGNRRVNPDAPILVVVAEILFNRLLHREAFDFSDVSAVVMDEFHSFNDPERGVVWELSLGLLPEHVRLLLLSATVGNAYEFTQWLKRAHNRRVELVQSDERKVPLGFQWVGDKLLPEFLEEIAAGDEVARRTPALVFCFNREQCWNVAEMLKGKRLVGDAQQKQLAKQLEMHDWSEGAGPKLKQILMRGIGVHHAGVLPRYKRIVEDLFQQKLLTITVCTETLAAGINLPARSVVLPELLKGPPDKKRLIDASSAHQMFGRAGRPQFDDQGYVFALAHEDDVRILRWREKYDQIPEDTKDPNLIKAKKALKKKMPTRRANQQYWNESQFEQLRTAPAGKLQSRGALPWRLLAYMLDASPDVDNIRRLVEKRLMPPKQLEAGQKQLDRMLLTLWRAGYVSLEPKPPLDVLSKDSKPNTPSVDKESSTAQIPESGGNRLRIPTSNETRRSGTAQDETGENESTESAYQPRSAHPTDKMSQLLQLRGVHPLYGVFLVNQLGAADRAERLQAMESVLEMPMSVGPAIRVPKYEDLPPGPLATGRLDVQLLQLGLASPEELGAGTGDRDDDDRGREMFPEERVWPLTLAEKLRRLFDHEFPGVYDLRTTPVWIAGELLEFNGNFNKYITSHGLQKQEGMIFRHLLRLILLIGEFAGLCPPDITEAEWQDELYSIRDQLVESCRAVDSTSTDKMLEESQSSDESATP